MRYDICTPRKKRDGGTYWVKIGSAWSKDGKPPQLVFDALPIPDEEGRCVASLFEPRDNGGGQQQRREPDGSRGSPRQSTRDELSDEIPFLTNDSVW